MVQKNVQPGAYEVDVQGASVFAAVAVGVGSVIFQGTTPARGDARLPESVRV